MESLQYCWEDFRRIFVLALFLFDIHMWYEKCGKIFCGFKVFKMASIINAGQYCYFSTVIQCLANNVAVRHLLSEHMMSIEHNNSKY